MVVIIYVKVFASRAALSFSVDTGRMPGWLGGQKRTRAVFLFYGRFV